MTKLSDAILLMGNIGAQQAIMLANIESNSAEAARGASTAAVFSILNHLR